MAASSSSDSCYSNTPRWKYHVFLSFRVEDRCNFTDHLYDALYRKGIITFRDEELERGEVIKHQILEAIEESLCSVVILSRNYASSGWCLDELQKILECRKVLGTGVLPIFYGIDPVIVRYQRESFAEAFRKHEKRFGKDKTKVQRWRDALSEIASLSGFVFRNWHEARLIDEIITDLRRKLEPVLSSSSNETSTSVEGENVTEDIKDLKNVKEAIQGSKQKVSYKPDIGLSQFDFVEEHVLPTTWMEEPSKSWRIRDFLYLILSYPLIIAQQKSVQKTWINDVIRYGTHYIKINHDRSKTNRAEKEDWHSYSGVPSYPSHGGLCSRYQSHLGFISTTFRYPSHGRLISRTLGYRYRDPLLLERSLAYVEGLIPKDIMRDIRNGRSSIFDVEAAQSEEQMQQLTDLTRTMEEKQVLKLKEVVDVIPESILNLAADLAVEQFIQTFLIQDIHNVRLTTRNEVEKQAVKMKIEAALKEVIEISEQDRGSSVLQGLDIETTINNKRFHRVLWVDAAEYKTNEEVAVAQEIVKQLTLHESHARSMKQKMMIRGYLVIVVDGNGEKKLDMQHVYFPQRIKSAGGVVDLVLLLTTESVKQKNDRSKMELDLEIRTKDHLLPWVLFCRNVGCELVSSSGAIQDIGVQIVEECRGHLLPILLVGKFLKNKTDVQLWKLALDKLRIPPYLYDRGTVKNPVMVNAFINIIWEDLNSIQKQCLECCCSFKLRKRGKVKKIFSRISKWVNNGIVDTREEAMNILQELVDRSILLKLEETHILLPIETEDILHSLLWLDQSTDIKQAGLGLTKMAYTGRWKIAKRIELMDNHISQLPQSPSCPKLRKLHLQRNVGLIEIPVLFFKKMSELRILDLSHTSISDLPNSLFSLWKLEELYLRGCELLMKLPTKIECLKALKKLDLEETPITHLPREIQKLTKLKSLTLCFDGYDQIIGGPMPHGVISKLTCLSYLSIDVNPDDKRWDENVQVILQEIATLRGLKTLVLYIPRVELLKYIPDAQHFDFQLVVGDHKKRIISREPPAVTAKYKESKRRLRFVYGLGVPDEINVILRRTKAFFLDRHMSIKSLSEFEVENVARLSVCIVAECNEMEMLVDGNFPNKNLLFDVEFLSVYYMKNLESIWKGPAPSPSSFCRLKYLAMQTCPKLTTIFTLDFLDNLCMLEELIVEDCPRLSTLISHESSEVKEMHFLPKLRKLLLVCLPELVSISNGLLIGESLEEMGIYYCPKLKVLFQKELSSEELKVIKGETKWWRELIWNQAEWGQAGRPNKFNDIFSPINEEADVMSQLIA